MFDKSFSYDRLVISNKFVNLQSVIYFRVALQNIVIFTAPSVSNYFYTFQYSTGLENLRTTARKIPRYKLPVVDNSF